MATRYSEPTLNWIHGTIDSFMSGPDNDLAMPGGPEPAFGPPLLGVAAGDDPLWDDFKKHVGPFHWTPAEAFALAFPQAPAPAEELSVLVWVLPQTSTTRADHRKETTMPSERWARARIMGEERVNLGLRRLLPSLLGASGIPAVAPMLMRQWTRKDSERFVYASTWSERHAAHAAGLGTFGLCDGLITPAGKSMRLGSVILRGRLPVTERPYTSHREYCLFFNSGICGKCIKRCPAGALSPAGHDKRLCSAYLSEVTAKHVRETYHFEGYGCGFCQVGVPCEAGIPPRPKKKEGSAG